ncbi:atrial natriuretic peptide receptor 2-like [Paramacrobiotus metropolitanus]|uniref:atrial natriuretic peptide receptor 2-like n=1 Tax=Paramacrobiotus metropolitanus TaxID=2943436 RepID=UPI002445A068|nr:atrial natriuretic peptide receptor 2-like [Paramacrobiotus metropolitanus]
MDYYKYYVICVVALAGEWTLVGGVLNVTIVSFGFPGGAEFISSAYSAPAMDVAVQDAMRLYNRTLNMEITYLDNRGMRDCNGVTALSEPLLAEWYYKQRISGNVNALIVPGCVTDNTIGHLVSNWDMLLITTASSNGNAQDVIKRPTWITTAFISTGAYIEVYLDLLHMFQWRSVMVITDRDSPPVYGAVARKVIAGISGILGYSVSQKEIFTRDNATMLRFPTLLRDFSRISRVMLIFGRGPVVRNLLISAGKLNMTNGEYVYVAMEPFRNRLYGRMDWQYNDTDDPMAREAFRSLLLVQPADSLIPQPEKNRRFSVQVLNRSETAYNNSYQLKDQPFPIIAAGYSAVMALAQVLNNLVVGLPGFDFSKGALIAQEFLGRSFPTRAEDVYFNEAGERRTDMVVSYCNGSESFTPILIKRKAEDHLLAINNVTWPNGVWPPPNEPKCGYFGQKCVSLEAQTAFWNTVKGVGFGVFGAIAVIFTVVLYRMRRNLQEKMLKDVWWRIDNSQMTLVPASTLRSTRRRALMSQSLNQRPVAAADDTKALAKNSFPAQYKGALVQLTVIAAIQDYSDVSQAFTSTALLALLKKLRGISHYNVCTFMGITVLPQTMKYAIVAEYAERGSVYELFESCLPMESNFIMSFVVELSQGLSYIHSSSLMYHGNLSSTTCLIDKHFTLKISELAYDKIIHIFSGERSASRKKPENRADAIGKQKPISWRKPR